MLQRRSEVGPCLAVVHVAHDRDDCRAWLGVLVAVCTATAPVTSMQLACMISHAWVRMHAVCSWCKVHHCRATARSKASNWRQRELEACKPLRLNT